MRMFLPLPPTAATLFCLITLSSVGKLRRSFWDSSMNEIEKIELSGIVLRYILKILPYYVGAKFMEFT